MTLDPLPAELVGTTRDVKLAWLHERGWRRTKGAWIDPQTGQSHIWGSAIRFEAKRHP